MIGLDTNVLVRYIARAGKIERALQLADEAVTEVDRTGERWWEAEALRSRADILLMASPGNHAEAERCFADAFACARRQGARLWELRAACSLAHLWLAQDRQSEARELLSPVCASFADGFEIADLEHARDLLGQLARPAR